MLREARPDPGAPAIDRGHVCLLAWYFPPMVTGGTYRPASLVKHGTDAGLEFTVIAAPLHQDPSEASRYLVEQLPSTARVVRVPPPSLEPLPIAVPGLDGGAMNTLEVWRAARRSFVDHRPEFVFATGPPFHTFVAAQLLAARFGVPLVLEYRDEWTECPFDFVQAGRHDRTWEARCLSAAWRVIFTTGSQLDRHVEVFPELDRARCVVIPNGWEPDDGPPDTAGATSHPSDATATRPVGRRTIAFTGNLGDHTLPGGFLDCLAAAVARRPDLAERFTFRFVGRRSRQAAGQLDDFIVGGMVELKDQVSKREVTRIVREVDGLLLLNPPALRRYVPGKLYEYLAAGRPILVYGENGEAGALVERLKAGPVVADDDAAGLIEALEWIEVQPGPLISGERKDWLARHTRETLAHRTIALLEAARDDAAQPAPVSSR